MAMTVIDSEYACTNCGGKKWGVHSGKDGDPFPALAGMDKATGDMTSSGFAVLMYVCQTDGCGKIELFSVPVVP